MNVAIAVVLAGVLGSEGPATQGAAVPEIRGAAVSPENRVPENRVVPEINLEDALRALDRDNPSLAQARARAEEASGIARQAAAALLPTLTASGTWTRNSDEARIALGEILSLPPGVTPPGPIVIQPREAFTATGALRVPVLASTAWFDLGAARDAARAAELSADATRRNLRASFAQAAHAARALEEAVLAAERARDTAADHARTAERRVAAGTAAPLDLLRARTDLVARESELVRIRSELARARLALSALLGRRGPIRVLVPPPPEPHAGDENLDALVAEALARRPELAGRRAQLAAAEDGLRSARARFLPELSGTMAAFASDVPNPAGEKEGWRATIDLTLPLYDGGFRYGKQRQARAALDGARAAADETELAIAREVEDALRELAVARERLRLAEAQRAVATDAAATARRSFEAGLAAALDVADANDRLFLADVGLADARARLAQARIALDRAVGRTP